MPGQTLTRCQKDDTPGPVCPFCQSRDNPAESWWASPEERYPCRERHKRGAASGRRLLRYQESWRKISAQLYERTLGRFVTAGSHNR